MAVNRAREAASLVEVLEGLIVRRKWSTISSQWRPVAVAIAAPRDPASSTAATL